jgi:orotidine-5'-phosphate decarboxylase
VTESSASCPLRDSHRGGVAFALDLPDLDAARALVGQVGDAVDMLKIGLELFVEAGHAAVRLGEEAGRPVFLDLKLHDIPETVDRAVARACALGVKLLTVHGGGGAAMLARAVERADKERTGLTVVAVTVLTSLDNRDLVAAGVNESVEAHVQRLARLAWSVGVRGFVSSAREVARMRQELGPEAILVTPGIRPSTETAVGVKDDQKRVATAAEATRDGATWLVVGRPIRDAKDPRAAALSLRAEIAGARARGAVEATP